MPEEVKSLRDQLNAAWEGSSDPSPAGESTDDPTPTPQELMNGDEPKTDPAPASDSTPKSESSEGDTKKPEGEDPAPTELKKEEPDTPEGGSDGHIKAPQSLSATEREHWDKVPRPIQEKMIAREREFSMGIQKYAEDAKMAQGFKEALAPYQAIMASEGASEVDAVRNLAQYAGVMRMGTTEQKASTIAKLIKNYGVDIPTLDDILSGQQPAPGQPQTDPALVERLNSIENMLTQGRQQSQQRTVEQVKADTDAFASDPKHEFFNDVRTDMADIMELAANRGNSMTLEQAYEKAVAMRDDLQSILANRNKQQKIEETRQNIQQKKQASSSLPAGDGGSSGNVDPKDLRGTIEQAWEQQSSVDAGRI